MVHSVKACEMSGDFVNLSVTAHKWLPMEEVKSFHLRPYLTSLIGQGYTLIALGDLVFGLLFLLLDLNFIHL